MPPTSTSQKSFGSLCLKIPGRAGFDYLVVGWWMYAWYRSWDKFILRFAQLQNHNGASCEGNLYMLMLNGWKAEVPLIMDYPFLCGVVISSTESHFSKHCLWLLNHHNGINIFHVQSNGLLYVGRNNRSFGLTFSGWVQSKADFKVVVLPCWEHLSFTKVHKGTEPKSWTPVEFYCSCKIQYCSLMYELLAHFLSNTYWLAQLPSPCEMKFCSAKFQYMGTENENFNFTCMETFLQWEQLRNCGRVLS